MKNATGWVIFLALAVLLIVWAKIEDAYNNDAPLDPMKTSSDPQPANRELHLSNGAAKLPLAVDEASFKEWNRAVGASDKWGQIELWKADRVFSVNHNTKVLRIQGGFFSAKVRVLEGEFVGRAGWVPNEWLK